MKRNHFLLFLLASLSSGYNVYAVEKGALFSGEVENYNYTCFNEYRNRSGCNDGNTMTNLFNRSELNPQGNRSQESNQPEGEELVSQQNQLPVEQSQLDDTQVPQSEEEAIDPNLSNSTESVQVKELEDKLSDAEKKLSDAEKKREEFFIFA